MQLVAADWVVVAVYGAITLTIGFWFTRRAGQSVEEYFVAGRTLPWPPHPSSASGASTRTGFGGTKRRASCSSCSSTPASGVGRPSSPTPSSSNCVTQGTPRLSSASFLAAFMSTMDTHLCWGASYLVNDVYRRLIRTDADARHYVLAARVSVALLAVAAAFAAWQMETIEGAWIYVIELTAGVALVWLLRWYWWRVNAWAEIAAMAGSVLLANGALWARTASRIGWLGDATLGSVERFYAADYDLVRALMILVACTCVWVVVAYLTRPDAHEHLDRFYRTVRPGGWWGPVAARCDVVVVGGLPAGQRWLGFATGLVFLYASLVGIGHLLTGRTGSGSALLLLGILTGFVTLSVATAFAADDNGLAPADRGAGAGIRP